MFLIIVQALFFFLPAYVANAVPVFLNRYGLFEVLNRPLDGGRFYKGSRLFGATKTFRGIIGGVAGAIFVITVQAFLYHFVISMRQFYLFPYLFPSILILGFLQGLGEGLGDLFKSFWKRRFHIQSSAPFFPFDQLSFLGALLLGAFYFFPEWQHIVSLFVVSPFIPVIANIIAYFSGWKKVWW